MWCVRLIKHTALPGSFSDCSYVDAGLGAGLGAGADSDAGTGVVAAMQKVKAYPLSLANVGIALERIGQVPNAEHGDKETQPGVEDFISGNVETKVELGHQQRLCAPSSPPPPPPSTAPAQPGPTTAAGGSWEQKKNIYREDLVDDSEFQCGASVSSNTLPFLAHSAIALT